MIKVCYFGPTNHRGARYIATGFYGRVSVMCEPELHAEQNALKAAQAYADRHLKGVKVAFVGELPKGEGTRLYATSWALVRAIESMV